MTKIHWFIKTLPFLIIGLFVLLLGIIEAFDIFNKNPPVIDRIKGSIIFFVLATVSFFPVYESVQKNVFGRKSWSDIAEDVLNIQYLSLPTDKIQLRSARIKAMIYVSLLVAFILIPVLFEKVFGVSPIYRYSRTVLVFLWLAIFPLLVWALWKLPRKAINDEHRKLLMSVRIILPAVFTLYLLFYIETLAHYVNTNVIEFEVDIEAVRFTGSLNAHVKCNYQVSGNEIGGMPFSICIDNIVHNLPRGNVAYIDDGHAVVKGRTGWVGTVVESVMWNQKYAEDDRTWSVQEQRYIYTKNE